MKYFMEKMNYFMENKKLAVSYCYEFHIIYESVKWKKFIIFMNYKVARTIFKLLGPCEILSHGQKAG